jgi:hypothetical protein
MSRNKRDHEQDLSRRALIKWGLAAGATLGVSRSRICEVLEKTAGKGVAYAAEDAGAGFSITINAGNGGLSNWQLLWPHVDIAKNSPNRGAIAWAYSAAETVDVPGTNGPLVRGPHTPWQSVSPTRQISCFMAGANQTHVNNANFALDARQMVSVIAALQSTRSSVVPVIGVGTVDYTPTAGGPPLAAVDSPESIVGLFNSAASRAGGLLANTSDAALYRLHYQAFAELNRAAQRSTTRKAYETAKKSAEFLGTNLASALELTADDYLRYGVAEGSTSNDILRMAKGMMIAVKAFKLGLCNSVLLEGMRDDPHDRFTNNTAIPTAMALQTVFDGLMGDLVAASDSSGKSLADLTTIVIYGDTPKDPLVAAAWPDGTQGNSNLVYAYGAGLLKTGWYGGIDRDGNVIGYNPATGAPAAYNAETTMRAATAAIADAVARGDTRRVGDFVPGFDYNGLVNPVLL